MDADEAVAILESRSDIALLFTDIQMPGTLDGLGFAHSVHERWPPIKIIPVSGQLKLTNLDIPDDSRFFEKPLEDGASGPFSPVDVIVASAGATHPLPAWIDVLKPGGRLLFPMTVTRGPGGMLLVTRHGGDEFGAQFLCAAAFYEFAGVRDADVSSRLEQALTRDRGAGVQSLRRAAHAEEETCWLHGDGWCLSRREITPAPKD